MPYREKGANKQGSSSIHVSSSLSVMRRENKLRAWVVSLIVLMIPTDPWLFLIPDSTNASGKFIGSFISLWSPSLKLWRNLKFLSCCRWDFFLLSRIFVSTFHTFSLIAYLGKFFICLDSSSSELPTEEFHWHFFCCWWCSFRCRCSHCYSCWCYCCWSHDCWWW